MIEHFPATVTAEHAQEFRDLTRKPAPSDTTPAEKTRRPDKRIRTNFNAYCHQYEATYGKPVPAGVRGKVLELATYDALVAYGVAPEAIRCDVLLGGHRARADFLVKGKEGVVGVFVSVSLRERWMTMDRNAIALMRCKDPSIVGDRIGGKPELPKAYGLFLTERPGDSAERCLTLATTVTAELLADNTRIVSLHDEHGICTVFEQCGAIIPQ